METTTRTITTFTKAPWTMSYESGNRISDTPSFLLWRSDSGYIGAAIRLAPHEVAGLVEFLTTMAREAPVRTIPHG